MGRITIDPPAGDRSEGIFRVFLVFLFFCWVWCAFDSLLFHACWIHAMFFFFFLFLKIFQNSQFL